MPEKDNDQRESNERVVKIKIPQYALDRLLEEVDIQKRLHNLGDFDMVWVGLSFMPEGVTALGGEVNELRILFKRAI